MLYALLLKLSALGLTAYWSVQAQPAEEERGRWWLWLLLLVVLSAFVAWLLGRESGRRATLPAERARPLHHTDPLAPPATPALRTVTPVVPVRPEPPPEQAKTTPAVSAEGTTQSSAPQTPPAPAQPDDLTLLEGIGPKIQGVLHAAGILSFADLAAAEPLRLKQILVEAGLRIQNPASWPQQAALAGAGQWEELKALQSQLSGGRRNA